MTLPDLPVSRTAEQTLAADPARHIWVAASAGTGKTHVLTDRLLRLLLAGSAPDQILALTFTRAAAAEMQNRLTKRLGQWLTLDDAALDAELEALGATSTDRLRARARCLFALALDVPGGLKVQTLHAFAQGLLAAFPVEAGLPPGFTALDERDARQLRRRALNEAIAEAQAAGDDAWLEDLAELSVLKGEGGVMRVLDRMIAHGEGLLSCGSDAGFAPAVRRFLGVGADEQPGERMREALAPGTFDDARLEEFTQAMHGWNTDTGLKTAASARDWLRGDADARVAGFGALWALVLTGTGQPCKHVHVVRKNPALRGLIDDIAHDVLLIADFDRRIAAADFAARALRAGHRIVARYRRLKRAAVAIDYDDMIAETARLLGPEGIPGYVNWKLDSRFDHVLVDEAQDTNQRQWDIIARVVEDYFDADPDQAATGRARSLFVVGDRKQAIYGFQGTDPRVFEAVRTRLTPRALAAGRPLEPIPLDRSFRSGPAVLDLVNAFLDAADPGDLGMAEPAPAHVPHRADAPGEVVLWNVLTPDIVDDEDDGTNGGVNGEVDSAAADRLMAETLAAQLAAWLEPGGPEQLWLPARARFARPEDILVLLRRRGALMGGLVGQLHRVGVPVAGVDRLLLTEPYAVIDLLALVRFAVQPEDDLNLASLLVSPFLGWSHEDVRAIAQPRAADLWAALGAAAAAGGPAADARSFLNAVLGLADRAGPYGFLDTILSGPLGGRRLLLVRLGQEANDPIDELLAQALAYEADHPPALAGFLAWVEAEGSEVKRDAEAPAGQVRLMTIHGAKGLEAPVVVLADTAHQKRANAEGYLPVLLDGAEAPVPLFHPGSAEMPRKLKALADARTEVESQEDLRLLYVALTRAADHLYIGGAVGRTAYRKLGTDKDRSWHSRLRDVFDDLGAAAEDSAEESARWGGLRRHRRGDWSGPRTAAATIAPALVTLPVFDDVLTSMAPVPGRPSRPLTPSALPEDPAAGPATAELRARARRGVLIHTLFERLPPVPPARRAAVAVRWLAGQGATLADADSITAEVLQVLEAPEHAALFGPDSLAEAPIAGLVGDRAIAGTVDRLLVEESRVLVVDFKTGLTVPATAWDVPMPYLRQMAAYVAVLARAFPGRRVAAALLFTAAPKFLLLEAKQLEGLESLD